MLKIFTNFGGIPSVSVVALDAATVTDIALMDFAAVAVCVEVVETFRPQASRMWC